MRRQRQSLIALAVAALVVSIGAVGVHASGAAVVPTAVVGGDGEGPAALSQHRERQRQALPGDQGLAPPGEGPGGSAEGEFDAKAYPLDVVPAAAVETSRRDFRSKEGRRLGGDDDNAGRWAQVGPSQALYPFEPLRNSSNYVPNAYVAGGRTTSVAIANTCDAGNCKMWITAAGGGVWRTDDALAPTPRWRYLAGPLGINAAGTVTIDPNDPTGNTIYVGTGEANTCGSGCVAGVGIYRSTTAGRTWEGPFGQAELGAKGIGEIVVKPGDPNTLYAATTTALRGMSSVCCTGVTRPVPGAAKWGLYKSTDRGASWAFVHNGAPDVSACTGDTVEFANGGVCSPRGVREVKLDPTDPEIVYASSYARGVWRSADGGATWAVVKESLNRAVIQSRASFDVTALPGGATRMYIYEGNTGNPYARLFRSDAVASGQPVFADLTSANPADPGFATYNLCGAQCWYDSFVHTPRGSPDIVYVGGSYAYGENIANKRAVILSTDAGVTGTDMTFDGTDETNPNGLHPDQHDIVTNPNNPLQFWEAGDGGVMRSTGTFVDRSSWCADRPLTPAQLGRCEQMLSRIPEKLEGVNEGLSTLQFMSLSVDPRDPRRLQGGTQDNGTWENFGSTTTWQNTMVGDGGQSGFDATVPEFRMHTFNDATPEVNFAAGKTSEWIYTADQLAGQVGTQFYAPVITDPRVSGTMFAGTALTAYRTKTFGLGDRTLAEANRICNTWTGTFEATCGDWETLGTVPLTDAAWGTRPGGAVAAIERVATDASTAWAATTTGRLFVSRNVDAVPASAVTWTRVDDDSPIAPNRFVSSIHLDPKNPGRAWVSYNGFAANTPTTPGHVFVVRVGRDGVATWQDRSFDLGDVPITDLVRDDPTGDLYASTDFGVMRLSPERGKRGWVLAAPGMPNVEVPGLTVVPGSRLLYAASHGLGAWRLNLDANDSDRDDGDDD